MDGKEVKAFNLNYKTIDINIIYKPIKIQNYENNNI
jgi:hypothetical protein